MTNDKLPDDAFAAMIGHLARDGARFICCMERGDIESALTIAETVGWALLAFALASLAASILEARHGPNVIQSIEELLAVHDDNINS